MEEQIDQGRQLADTAPTRFAAIAALLWSPRVRAIWLLALSGWVLFAAFRAGLLIASGPSLDNVGAGEIAFCFLRGLRYDAMPIGYAMLPLALVLSLAPPRAFGRRWFRRCVGVYAIGVLTLAVFAEIVGAAFFLHFGSRLNWNAMDYFGHFGELARYIWKTYPVVLFALVLAALVWGGLRLFRRALWSRHHHPHGSLVGRAALAAVLVGLCVLGARGGFDHRPLRSGSAYFCENNVVSQLTMNNFYTFSHAAILQLEDGRDEEDLYPFPDPPAATAAAAELIYQPADTPLDAPGNPLWRRTETGRPRQDYNVVLIVMEGMSGSPVGALGHSPSETPHFDALCKQGLYFEQMYGVGTRTSRGLTGVLCGYPDLGGPSVLKRDASQGEFLTLPSIFRDRGYRTMFIYGGNPEFDNMQGFLSAGGVEEFISQADMPASPAPGNWGSPDEAIFRRADERFRRMGDRPFFATILTVSNHEPYDVPASRVPLVSAEDEERLYLNGYRYADWALGQFFDRARQADYFRRTIFVLVADHCRDRDRGQLIDVPGFRVPCLFYAPGLIEPTRSSVVASQTDVAPTLLAMLGGRYEHCFFGRDLRNVAPGDGFALLREVDRLGFVRDGRAVILPPRHEVLAFRTDATGMAALPADDELTRRMQREMLSYYQTARQLYLARAYQAPPETAPQFAAAPGDSSMNPESGAP